MDKELLEKAYNIHRNIQIYTEDVELLEETQVLHIIIERRHPYDPNRVKSVRLNDELRDMIISYYKEHIKEWEKELEKL